MACTYRCRDWVGRWLASADTPDSPSLRPGRQSLEALGEALQPFDGVVDARLEAA
jgi:hypothetical protein